MSLTRQEVFQVLADGKDVEFRSADFKWVEYYCGILNKETFDDYIWRIKPKPLEWYENIPEHGVLCWVGDNKPFVESTKIVNIIKMREVNQFISIRGARWNYALPLTNEEIKQFLQGE